MLIKPKLVERDGVALIPEGLSYEPLAIVTEEHRCDVCDARMPVGVFVYLFRGIRCCTRSCRSEASELRPWHSTHRRGCSFVTEMRDRRRAAYWLPLKQHCNPHEHQTLDRCSLATNSPTKGIAC